MKKDISAAIRHTFEVAHEAQAVEYRETWSAWGELAKVGNRVLMALERAGVSADAPVCLVVRNRPSHVATLLGLLAAGRTVSFINAFQAPEKIAGDVGEQNYQAIIADEQDWSDALRGAVLAAGAAGISLGLEMERSGLPVEGLDRQQNESFREAIPGTAIEMLTSGTSGKPKRISLSYPALSFAVSARHSELARLGGDVLPDDLPSATLIQVSPIVQIGGLFSILHAAMDTRPIVLLEKFNVDEWRRWATKYRPRFLTLQPATMRMVLDAGCSKADAPAAIAVRSGAAALDDVTRRRFEEQFGIPVLIVYGATEYCGPIASWSLEDFERFGVSKRGSVGKIWPHISTARIAAPKTDLETSEGQGVLEVLIPSVSPDWITTNDFARIDEDGFLFIEGRADEAINRGGFKVVPDVVAEVLRGHPSVADASVVGIPDERLGAVPVAVVSHRVGTPRPDPVEIEAFARRHLVAYQVPTKFLVVDDLPRNPALKVSRVGVLALFSR